MLNGDRGEVDYTVSTGDLKADTHNAPPQPMIGIMRSGQTRMQRAALSVASLSVCKVLAAV